MSVLQKDHDVDLEAAKFNDNCVGDGISIGSDVTVIVKNNRTNKESVSNLSECSVDMESGVLEPMACLAITNMVCRICHQNLENQESGVPIELGCSCKDDLAAAHKHCAETWFKIKGNRTCEICGSVAQNVVGVPEAELEVQWSEANDIRAIVAARLALTESRNLRKGHRILFFLLIVCVVCAIILSWRFDFKNKHKP